MRPVYYPEDSVFVTGTAKVTKEGAINTVYGVFSLSMVIDIHSNRIISVSANMIMEETNDFLSYLMTGKNIVTDIDDICASLRRRFLALSQKAVMVALRDAQNRYLMAYPHTRETETQN